MLRSGLILTIFQLDNVPKMFKIDNVPNRVHEPSSLLASAYIDLYFQLKLCSPYLNLAAHVDISDMAAA